MRRGRWTNTQTRQYAESRRFGWSAAGCVDGRIRPGHWMMIDTFNFDSKAMQKDIRATDLYREAEAMYLALRRPGTGQISDAAEVHVSPDGTHAVFAGTLTDKLEGTPATRICMVDLASGETRVLTFGPNRDRLPKFSPDSKHIAFLSDRHKAGDFQLYLLDPVTGAARCTQRLEGWAEYLQWSPDSNQIVLGIAGHGADISGGQGAVASKRVDDLTPSWMPTVETGCESFQWRRAWVYDLVSNKTTPVGPAHINVWEAVWCGNGTLVAVVSPGPREGLWYSACLHLIDVKAGKSREIYKPQDQLGWPAAAPSGTHVAVVEAACSDRGIVAGCLRLVDLDGGKLKHVDTHGVDVTHLEWRTDRHLLVAGHRGFQTVVGLYDRVGDIYTEVWSNEDRTGTGRYITVSGCNELGDFALVSESFVCAPEIAVIRAGQYRSVRSFDLGYAEQTKVVGAVDRVSWVARDGLDIQGWLLRPTGAGPYPLIMHIHGGPVWHWRPMWLGRGSIMALMLIKRGYAVFLPNPRGSSGRGQDFVRCIYGDLGGADAKDLLSGLDALVERQIADPKRLGVTGGSYGGFMASWLITQDDRFAAAAPVVPLTNQVTEHLIGNIPHFVELFLQDKYNNPGGKYFDRSPIMHAHKAKTPTLNVCGALDRCTPPEEAVQFHNALLGNGVKSVLVTYPEEGHGVRTFPAAIDYAARLVAWFEEHLAVGPVAPNARAPAHPPAAYSE